MRTAPVLALSVRRQSPRCEGRDADVEVVQDVNQTAGAAAYEGRR
jgi:hypothetical protein